MNKSKIAFLLPSLEAGGAERVVATLSNSLVEHYDITIIALYESPVFYDIDPKINVLFCGGSYEPVFSLKHSLKTHFRLIRTVIKFLKRHKIDVVIGFMITPNIYAVIASKWVKIPCVISERVHPDYIDTSKFWFKLRKFLYPLANRLVVQTNDIAEYFSKFVNDNKIQIILNPLSPELIQKKNHTVPKKNIVLNVGRLDYQKNQDMLINAFANTRHEGWKLVIVGEGKEREHYNSLIDELHLNDKVQLVGNSTNIEDFYNKASVFAFTSRYEGFPNALTEAMYFGLPCISTDCPSGPSELIADSENGYLIPIENQKLLEDRLNILMSSTELRIKIGSEAEKNTGKFKIENVAKQWQETINNLLK